MTTYRVLFEYEGLIVGSRNDEDMDLRLEEKDLVLIRVGEWVRTQDDATMFRAIRERANELLTESMSSVAKAP